MSMPGMVEAEATKPSKSVGVPRLFAKGFKTGFFDIVELRIAKKPMMHSIRKKLVRVRFLRDILVQINLCCDFKYVTFAARANMFIPFGT
jgi:hypothetical protein